MRLPLLLSTLLLPLPAAAANLFDKAVPERGLDRVFMDLGGMLQPRFTFEPTDEAAGAPGHVGFKIARIRLEWKGGIEKQPKDEKAPRFRLGHTVSVEFYPEVRLQDGFVEMAAADALVFRLGQQKSPTNRTSNVSDHGVLLPERAHLERLAPRRELGASLGGALGPGKQFDWAVGIFNGEGTNRTENVNHKFLVAGHVAVSPNGTPGGGSELLRDGWKCPKDPAKQTVAFTVGYNVFYNVDGPGGTETATLGHVGEAFLHYRWVTLQAELLLKQTDFEDTAVADFQSMDGYVQLGLFPPMVPWVQDHLAVLLRFEQFDDNIYREQAVPLTGATDPAQAQRWFSVGVGFYPSRPTFLKVGDLRAQVVFTKKDELEGQPYDNDELMLALHLSI